MTITRLGTLTAELKTTAGISLYGGGSVYPVCSGTKAKSGAYAYESLTTDPPFGKNFTATTSIRCGFFHNHMGGSATRPLITIAVGESVVQVDWNGATNQFRLQLGYAEDSASPYYPIQNIAGGSFSQTDAWRHIGVTYLCDDTTGYFSLYVDGERVINLIGGDTTIYKPSNTVKEPPDITGVFVGGSGWANKPYADDIYIDSYAGETDAAPPAKRFLICLASNAGANAEWTPLASTNISQIDDPITDPHDGDATYNKALAPDLKDSFRVTTLVLPDDYHIEAVLATAIARKLDSGDCDLIMRAFYQAGQVSAAAQPLTTSYAPVEGLLATKPGGGAWTVAVFNAAEFGYVSDGSFA